MAEIDERSRIGIFRGSSQWQRRFVVARRTFSNQRPLLLQECAARLPFLWIGTAAEGEAISRCYLAIGISAGVRTMGAMAPSVRPRVDGRSTVYHRPLIAGSPGAWRTSPGRARRPVLRSARSSLTITLRSREAGVTPAQSRYGDQR